MKHYLNHICVLIITLGSDIGVLSPGEEKARIMVEEADAKMALTEALEALEGLRKGKSEAGLLEAKPWKRITEKWQAASRAWKTVAKWKIEAWKRIARNWKAAAEAWETVVAFKTEKAWKAWNKAEFAVLEAEGAEAGAEAEAVEQAARKALQIIRQARKLSEQLWNNKIFKIMQSTNMMRRSYYPEEAQAQEALAKQFKTIAQTWEVASKSIDRVVAQQIGILVPKVKITNNFIPVKLIMVCKNQDNLGILGMHNEILQKIEQFMPLPYNAPITSIKKAYASISVKLTRSQLITYGKHKLIAYYNSGFVWMFMKLHNIYDDIQKAKGDAMIELTDFYQSPA